MARYKLRTLLILLAVGPPLVAAMWPTVKEAMWPPQRIICVPDGTFPVVGGGIIDVALRPDAEEP
jgi:hypothetical protein